MKSFGHQRPRRDERGEIVGLADCPARAVTVNPCGPQFGPDSRRRLVVTLERGDLVSVRPQGTRRVLRCAAADLYFWLLRGEANRINLEKARDRKTKIAAARLQRQERRLFSKH